MQQINARIGAMLERSRKKQKINQMEIALHLGIDQSALSRVENGLQLLTAPQWVLLHKLKLFEPDAILQILDPQPFEGKTEVLEELKPKKESRRKKTKLKRSAGGTSQRHEGRI